MVVLYKVLEYLNSVGTVNKSCGTHIHLDGTNLGPRDVANFVSLYSRWEPVIMRLLPPSRRGNHYCEPLFQKTSEVDAIAKASSRTALAQAWYGGSVSSNKYHGSRYSMLNVHSWFYRGTLEIRGHQGTLNFDKITTWVKLFWAMLDKRKLGESSYVPKGVVREIATRLNTCELVQGQAQKMCIALGLPQATAQRIVERVKTYWREA